MSFSIPPNYRLRVKQRQRVVAYARAHGHDSGKIAGEWHRVPPIDRSFKSTRLRVRSCPLLPRR
jgi:hypothetical protein